jgi:hypothetical protein
MALRQQSLHDAAEQYADQRQSKCNKRDDNRSHEIHPINASAALVRLKRTPAPGSIQLLIGVVEIVLHHGRFSLGAGDDVLLRDRG